VNDAEVAGRIGDGVLLGIGGVVMDCDGGAGNYGSRAVEHRAANGSVDRCLGMSKGAKEEHEDETGLGKNPPWARNVWHLESLQRMWLVRYGKVFVTDLQARLAISPLTGEAIVLLFCPIF
jgi:hypothetical protein